MTTQHGERPAVRAPGQIVVPAGAALAGAGIETQGLDIPENGPGNGPGAAVLVALAQSRFVKMGSGAIRALGKPEAMPYDIKGISGKSGSDLRL